MTATPEPRLFDAGARSLAAEHHGESAYRWLTLSRDAEAREMRASLEHCWQLAGDSRPTLARGLAHERWGQHVGALAHLLALGLFAHEGWRVRAEPDLDGQTPDLLAESDELRVLVEVRAMTGCGLRPWDREDTADEPTPEELAASLLPAPAGDGVDRSDEPENADDVDDEWMPPPSARRTSAAGHAPVAGRPARRGHDRALARRAATERAIQRAACAQAVQRDLRASVDRVLRKKARAYAELCRAQQLPYVICLYQDTDRTLGPLVRSWAYGAGPGEPAGAFVEDDGRLAHVSAVIVFGRQEGDQQLLLRGEIVPHPGAARPLPSSAPLADLERHAPGVAGLVDTPHSFPILPMRSGRDPG